MDETIRIIIIDDSEAMLVMINTMLNDLGYHNVTAFSSPIKALAELHQYPTRYDVVFTDLNMPDIDGMGLIRHLGEMHYKGGSALCPNWIFESLSWQRRSPVNNTFV